MEKQGTITFETETQAALWEMEIVGQISDGYWENARPFNHWREWCNAKVLVGKNIGITFYPVKDNYNLMSKGLLDVVGGRMTGYAKLAKAFGRDLAKALRIVVGDDGKFGGVPTYAGEYWDQKRARLAAFNMDNVRAVLDADSYSMMMLRDDLRLMLRAMQTHKPVA